MLHTELGDRILVGGEGKLFAETLWDLLEREIRMGESNSGWNEVFCRLTHEQQVWLLNEMMRAALLPEVEIPESTAAAQAALHVVYEQMHINLIVELDLARLAVREGKPAEEWMFSCRKMVLQAAKEQHLTSMFEGFIEANEVTEDVIANNKDDRYDQISIWPTHTCDDISEWAIICDLLVDAVFLDEDWLSDTITDIPPEHSELLKAMCSIPPGYFDYIPPDPLPEQARDIFIDMVQFLRRFLGYPDVARDKIHYYGPDHGGEYE